MDLKKNASIMFWRMILALMVLIPIAIGFVFMD